MLLETMLILASSAGMLGIGAAMTPWSDDILLDDGGIRLRRAKVYLPYDTLADARVERGVLGATYLVIVARNGVPRKLRVRNATPSSILGDVLHGITAHSRVASAAEIALAREGRPLQAWLDAIEKLASDETTYRAVPLDLDALVAIATDTTAGTEARGAAIYTVLQRGGDADVAKVLALPRTDLPPIVVGAVRCARGSMQWVGAELVKEIGPFLDVSDREAITAAQPRASEAVAMTRLETVIRALPKKLAPAPETETSLRRRERLPQRSSSEVTRWPRGLR